MGQVGQLAFTLGGAAIGGYFGGAEGARTGAAIGAAVGSVVFAPDTPDIYGPRLKDVGVTTATYGSSISRLYGTTTVSGMMIWSTDKIETAHSSGGGKGSSTGGTTTYSYKASFAIGLCEGEIDDVVRIWADNRIIYDKGDSTTQPIQPAKFTLGVFKGTETQLPSSVIAADVGEANTPAYRGLAYVVMENFELEDYGNRIPTFSFLVTKNATNVYPSLEMFNEVDNLNSDIHYFSPEFDRACCNSDFLLFAYNHVTMEETWRLDFDIWTVFMYDSLGNIHCADSVRYYVIHGETGAVLGSVEHAFGTEAQRWRFGCELDYEFELDVTVIAVGDYLNKVVHFYDRDSLQYYGHTDELDTGVASGTKTGAFAQDSKSVWFQYKRDINIVTNEWYLNHVLQEDIMSAVAYALDADPPDWRTDIEFTQFLYELADVVGPDSLQTGNVDWEISAFDNDSQTLDMMTPNAWLQINLDELNQPVLGQRFYIFADGSTHERGMDSINVEYSGHPRDGYVYVPAINNTATWVNTISGEITDVELGTGNPWGLENSSAFNSGSRWQVDYERNGVFGTFSYLLGLGEHFYKIFPERITSGGVDLAVIVADIIEAEGLTAADYDVTALVGIIVPGYVVNQAMTGVNYLAPLMTAYSFDLIETDFIFKAVLRGSSSVLSIPQDDLKRIGGETLPESRIQEVELPLAVHLNFTDVERNYEQSGTTSRRVELPTPTMYSRSAANQSLPIALTAETAKQIADKVLYANWAERTKFKAGWGWKYLALDPSDVISVTANGKVHQVRIDQNAIGADLSMETGLTQVDDGTYVSNVPADSGQGYLSNDLLDTPAVQLLLLDLNALWDVDSNDSSNAFVYAAISCQQTSFRGAEIYRESSGGSRSYLTSLELVTNQGATTTLLADHPAELTDETNSVIVRTSDTLVSSDLTTLNDGLTNACLIGDELLQYATVVDNLDGTFTLSDLLRGRRGTEGATGTHTSGDLFTPLALNNLVKLPVLLAELNLRVSFYSQHYGATSGNTASVTWIGNHLKPYSVAQLEIIDNVTTLDTTWERRNRLSATWQDDTPTIPNSETLEQYVLEITVGLVTQTKTVNDATSFSYTVAEFEADFPAETGFPDPGLYSTTIYQISSAVGRGYPATGTN